MTETKDWREALQALHGDGYTSLDLLAAVDRSDDVEIIVRALDPRTGAARQAATRTQDGVVPSATAVFPAAAWYEREVAEMFGVTFDGLLDTRPLLLHAPPAAAPLLKRSPLTERMDRDWPGGAGSRGRRQLPPGVRAEWEESAGG